MAFSAQEPLRIENANPSEMNLTTIRIDPDVIVGPVKPVNGVGQPPMFGALGEWPMFHYLAE